MTSFVNVAQPTEHRGDVRAERAADPLQRADDDIFSPRGAASLLLAAIVSALLVVANQVIDTWTEGHLLLAWIAMWTIAFATLALAARPAHSVAKRLGMRLHRWTVRLRAAEQDEKLWQSALADWRVMADLSRAMNNGAGVRRYY